MTDSHPVIPAWRRRLAVALVVVGSLLLPIAVLGSWIRVVGLESEAWAAISGRILEDPIVRDRVSHELVDRLFDASRPEDVLGERLPPKLQFLAGPLSNSAREAAYGRVDRLLASKDFQQAWREANVDAHRELVAVIESRSRYVTESNGSVELDVRPLLTMVAHRIGLEGRVIKRIPDDVANIKLGLEDELETVRSAVRLIRAVTIGLIVLAGILFAGALLLGVSIRIRVIRWIANGVLLGGVALLVVRSLGGELLRSRVEQDPAVLALTRDSWDIATQGIATAGWTAVAIAIVLRGIAWIAAGRAPGVAGRPVRALARIVQQYSMAAHLVWVAGLAAMLVFVPSAVLDHLLLSLVVVIGAVALIEMLRRVPAGETVA